MAEPLKPGDLAPSFRLQPVFGLPVEIPGRVSLLLFLRPLGSANTRSMLAALQSVHRELDGIQVVQFTRSSLLLAQDFVPRQHLLLPLVCDPAGEWYARYGVGANLLASLLKPAAILRYPQRLSLGHGKPEAPYGQQAAALVVGADGRVRWAWYGKGIFDLPEVSMLLEALRA